MNRPLPGPMAALYHLRVPSSGGLRLGVIATEDGLGRMTISEQFGGAVAVAGWEAGGQVVIFDLREGCRLEGRSAGGIFGMGELPLDRAVRLLGGRLPALTEDSILQGDRSSVEIVGEDWRTLVDLESDPWRIVRVTGDGFEVVLDRHTASVAGRLRLSGTDGDWAELELVRLQWGLAGEAPDLPDLPYCE
ncbi:MAG: hypothetical protein K8R59_09870 [Thermoanaerobaculales bacterium]|nr:hypothetical protein [Thermoanaerobaculales bacterium]